MRLYAQLLKSSTVNWRRRERLQWDVYGTFNRSRDFAHAQKFMRFYRAMLCIRGTSHGPVSVSVCLSQVGVLLKRQNVGSHKQHHTIPQESSFLMPKIFAKFDRGHPLRERRMQVGWVKIGDFRQVTGYISKTVKDRHIVSIKVE